MIVNVIMTVVVTITSIHHNDTKMIMMISIIRHHRTRMIMMMICNIYHDDISDIDDGYNDHDI